MSKISRRDLFKATLAARLGVTLPGGVQAHGRRTNRTRAALTVVGGNIVHNTGIV
jgi:hypothetical protein